MKLDVLNIRGEKTGRTVELADEIFGIEPNDHVIYLDVKQYLNNWRQGTHKAKQRNEISGSTKKLRKQKGGGGARVGSIKNPTFRGGGRMHGPQPRDYGFKLNKKVKDLARRSAFAHKVRDNAVMIIEDFNMETPKTKEFINILNALNLRNQKTLLIMDTPRENIIRSARNLPEANLVHSGNINTYHVMNSQAVVMLESAIEPLTQTLTA
jgi:large subunit ribosomal protein L4